MFIRLAIYAMFILFSANSNATFENFSYDYKHQYGKDKQYYWGNGNGYGYGHCKNKGNNKHKCQNPTAVDLGAANDFLIATGGYGNISLGAGSNINGNVSAGFVLNIGAGTTIDGNACAGYAIIGSGVKINEHGNCPNRWSLYNDIQNASNVLASYSPYPFMDITSSKRLKKGVYSVNDFTLDNGDTLTLEGAKDDVIVINVLGLAKLDLGSKIILQGGLKDSNVFFNFVGSYGYDTVQIASEETSGTFISDSRRFIVSTNSTDSSRFYTNGDILGNFQGVTLPPGDGNTIIVPFKGGCLLSFLLLFSLFGRKVREQKKCDIINVAFKISTTNLIINRHKLQASQR